MTVQVKICGLKTEEAIDAAVDAGAAYIGFILFPRSPRALTPEAAGLLRKRVPKSVRSVAVTVDANDALLDRIMTIVGPDMLQLHGQETPTRTGQLRRRYAKPVIKALPIAERVDFAPAAAYAEVADMLLFDAKPAPGDTRPGGNARSFEWSLLKDFKSPKPWLLAGGLTAETLAEAVAASGATAIDVSSGVETAPGEKDVALIRALLDKAKAL